MVLAKFETWLEMNLLLVDDGAALQKIVLEGPDGTVWGTWPREFPNLAQSITGMLGSLRDELPKGKHSAKLIALGSDGTQLSCYPMTVVGASDSAHEAAQNQLTAQRANAMFLANVEKAQAGMMTIMQHTSDMVSAVVEANRNLTADAERFKNERDEGRLRVLREEGKQRRLDEVAAKVLPLVELGLGLLSEFGAEWFQEREAKKAEAAKLRRQQDVAGLPSTAGQSGSVQSLDASATVGTDSRGPDDGETPSVEPVVTPDTGCDPQSRATGLDVSGCNPRNHGGIARRAGDPRGSATKRANREKVKRT